MEQSCWTEDYQIQQVANNLHSKIKQRNVDYNTSLALDLDPISIL